MKRTALIVSPLLALALVGCSDDGDANSPPGAAGGNAGPPLSKADFVRQAEQICTDTRAAGMAIDRPSSAADVGASITQAADLLDGAVTGLRGLNPPVTDVDEIAGNLVGPLQEQARVIRDAVPALEAAAAAKDIAGLQAAVPDLAAIGDVDVAYLRDYGLPTCLGLVRPGG